MGSSWGPCIPAERAAVLEVGRRCGLKGSMAGERETIDFLAGVCTNYLSNSLVNLTLCRFHKSSHQFGGC